MSPKFGASTTKLHHRLKKEDYHHACCTRMSSEMRSGPLPDLKSPTAFRGVPAHRWRPSYCSCHKLPPEARVQGDAMALYFVDWDTLYLYIEEDEGRKIAIFDVSNPGKIRFKTLVPLDVPEPFDFVSLAGLNSMLIRFRDGSGKAILDLRRAMDPQVRTLSERPAETYIIPVASDPSFDEERNSYRCNRAEGEAGVRRQRKDEVG